MAPSLGGHTSPLRWLKLEVELDFVIELELVRLIFSTKYKKLFNTFAKALLCLCGKTEVESGGASDRKSGEQGWRGGGQSLAFGS